MKILVLLILSYANKLQAFEFNAPNCIQTNLPKLCSVVILRNNDNSAKKSISLQIQLKISQPFQRVSVDHQDMIDRQIAASKLRHQSSRLYGMDQSSASLIKMMASLSDQPKSYEEMYRKQKLKQLETFEFFRNNPESYNEWASGQTYAKFATDYWDENLREETVVLPAAQLIFYDKNNLSAVLRNDEDGNWTLLLPEGRIAKLPRKVSQQTSNINIELPFQPEFFRLALMDEDDKILDHLGTRTGFSHRGAYLILQNFEVLPRIKL